MKGLYHFDLNSIRQTRPATRNAKSFKGLAVKDSEDTPAEMTDTGHADMTLVDRLSLLSWHDVEAMATYLETAKNLPTRLYLVFVMAHFQFFAGKLHIRRDNRLVPVYDESSFFDVAQLLCLLVIHLLGFLLRLHGILTLLFCCTVGDGLLSTSSNYRISNSRYLYIFTAIFYGADYASCDALATPKEPDVVNMFNRIYQNHGAPQEVITDNGVQFTVDFSNYVQKSGGKLHYTTLYHPRSNDKCERFNGILKGMLTTAQQATPWNSLGSVVAFYSGSIFVDKRSI
ncbi:hypothetical protein TRICI_002997 [Trichomonascus ciferrii]|uniref:Integrase catalytic domain-containing protein n=1 Tax=Trichomonascus ciferrii TaxID=44093 RepID=A0A642V515_9ASCO|nr:hypothetical protein TRICI_002997 [Trichomonascus ciferrii]